MKVTARQIPPEYSAPHAMLRIANIISAGAFSTFNQIEWIVLSDRCDFK